MHIETGDPIPSGQLRIMREETAETIDTDSYFKKRKIVMFAVPGAFTPTCSISHLPGYVSRADRFHAMGVDAIACVSVNDVFVMDAWGRSANAGRLDMLADGNGDFTAAMGFELDARAYGMGVRSHRYALVAEDGIVTRLFVENPGEFRVSAAEYVLSKLQESRER
jgi:peroxiredoxin